MNPDLELAFLAGLLEGEGWFSINVHKAGPTRKTESRSLKIGCEMREDSLDLIDRLVAYWGGSVYHREGRGGAAPTVTWNATGGREAIMSIMDEIYPYMSQRRRERMDEIRALTPIEAVPHG